MSIMYSELNEAERVVRQAIDCCTPIAKQIVTQCKNKSIKHVIVAGRGSSMNAGISFKFFLETTTDLFVSFEYPSIVNLFGAKRDLSDTLYILISQSGAGTDTIHMAEHALSLGATVVACTNDSESPVAKKAHFVLDMQAGQEHAVAATKTFTGEIIALQVLAEAFCGRELPSDYLQDSLKIVLGGGLPKMPLQLTSSQNAIILSRGFTEVVAKECALKLMETCYLFTYSSSTNEFQHGPKALISDGTPVILFAPSGRCEKDFVNTAKDLKSKGAYIIAFSDIPEMETIAPTLIKMPTLSEAETSIVYTVKMQQFVATLCGELGLSPDAPRNLNKITITC